ncbi:NAD(P)-binding domain-containing protein [Telmatospirillum sp. J64-1]|uniref:NAD(P)-binding domain-containing protein n=1 Tax=Telmatospirillum sp. J64-1 TaxID=2502183 RepID=UPI00115CABB3|nr:NAD(P)/FAD-dependent oxidoreductase [Telmatospirillum sp. J64-1]
MTFTTDALEALAKQIKRDLHTTAYPDGNWVQPYAHSSGQHVYDTVIVGAGQSGMACGFGLKRDGIRNILLIDGSPAGMEGVWENFARMKTLRTPKHLVGLEHGLASLSVRAWFEARHGEEAWQAIDRIPRTDWMEYLRWFRARTDLPIRNDTRLEEIEPDGDILALHLRTGDKKSVVLTRYVILATGYDGGGEWRAPPHISQALPADRYAHSNGPVDFERLKGLRVGVLGHGASAFDNSVRAIESGAQSVELCFRREQIPLVNPHRWIEFTGFLKHFPDLEDRIRWNVNRYFKKVDQPPARGSFDLANSFANFRMHCGSPWNEVRFEDNVVKVKTPKQDFEFDFVICATGMIFDLDHRSELRPFVGDIARWRDRYAPPPGEEHPGLAEFPYLGKHYELQALDPEKAPWLQRMRAFNFSAIVSMGPHSTSISGHKYSVPRVVRGLTRDLLQDQAHDLMPALEAYDEIDLDVPPDAFSKVILSAAE